MTTATLDLTYIDIDGVVADDRHRQHFITNPKPKRLTKWVEDGKTSDGKAKWKSDGTYQSYAADYNGYFGDAALDTVWAEGRELVERVSRTPGMVTGFLTGRRVDMRAVTARWLLTNGFDPSLLVMKPYGMSGKLAEFKLGIVQADLAVGWNSVTVYDDDPRVIDLLNAYALEHEAPVEAILCEWHTKPVKMQFAAQA